MLTCAFYVTFQRHHWVDAMRPPYAECGSGRLDSELTRVVSPHSSGERTRHCLEWPTLTGIHSSLTTLDTKRAWMYGAVILINGMITHAAKQYVLSVNLTWLNTTNHGRFRDFISYRGPSCFDTINQVLFSQQHCATTEMNVNKTMLPTMYSTVTCY